MPQARAMRLVVDPRDGAVRLTLPKRAALRPALEWVESKRGWIEAALDRLPVPVPILPGGLVPFEGVLRRVDWDARLPRAMRVEADRILIGGPGDSLAARILRAMRQQALTTLDRESREYGALAGVTIGRVAVGDPRARWGSCSIDGDLRYSWRLILAPPEVRRATVAHEVAHRLHMDHSPAFHAAVKRLFGRAPTAERAWLRANGAALYWLGRDG